MANPCKITITAANGLVTGVSSYTQGTYTVLPGNPVQTTGSVNGEAATFNLTPSSLLTAAAVTGGGYQINDTLQLSVNSGVATTQAALTVTGVTSTGGVSTVSVTNPGLYTTLPSGNVAVVAGPGQERAGLEPSSTSRPLPILP